MKEATVTSGPEASVPLRAMTSSLLDTDVVRRPGPLLRFPLLRWGITPLLVATDLLAGLIAVDVARLPWRYGVVLAATLVVGNAIAGLHRSRLTLSLLDDLPALVGRVLIAGGLALLVDDLLQHHSAPTKVVLAAGLALIAVLCGRALAYEAVRSVRRRGIVRHPTLVLGAGEVGGRLVDLLREKPEFGLLPVGFVDSDPLLDESRRPVPVLGGYDELAQIIRDFSVGEVIIAFGGEREADMVDLLRTCDRMECEIFVVPRLFEMHSGTGRAMDSIYGMPLVRMRRAAFRSPMWRLKRLFDILVAVGFLLFLAPLLAALAIAVRIDLGKGGILFRQRRVGVDGRPFRLVKFRTLTPVSGTESAQLWSVAGDARLGRVGRFLRRTSLDELPQLWNVLRGDMTLVGPRPERPFFVEEFTRSLPRYAHRHRVPAGMTGWAQVHGLRGDTSMEHRVRFDNYYVENWSLWLDIKILLRTLTSFLRGAA